MNRKEQICLIEHLLHCTVDAHKLYQEQVLHGDTDANWTEWFAEYLIGHGLDNLIGDRLEVDQIAAFLEEVEKENPVKPSEVPWMRLAANKMARLSGQSAF